MLQFFKSTLPSRLLALLLLILALRLPLHALGIPLTPAELHALLVGERVHAGALPYRDLYDSTAPLVAWFLGGLDAVAARPLWLYRILALTALVAQALRFNFVLNHSGVHPERGYVAALTYLLLASITTDLDTLSPLLLGQTSIVFALSALLPTLREGYDNRRLFRAGFLIGLGALSFLPLALFLVVALFAVIIFAANSFRSFLLLVCGFLFPYAAVATLYLYADALPSFSEFHLKPMLQGLAAAQDGLPRALQLQLLVVPGIVLVLALARTFTTSLGLVFQAKFMQLMLVWLVQVVGLLLLTRGTAPGSLVLLLPPLAYFSLFLWQKSARSWVPGLLMLMLLAVVEVVRYRGVLQLDHMLPLPLEENYAVRPNPVYAELEQQRLLVLGPDRRPYLHNQLATPYLDWQLAQVDFGHLNQYAAVFRLARNIGPQPPTYIIDQARLMPELQYKVPAVFGRYQRTATPGLYELK
ncbi:hypothetical protein LRS06_06955 [Hymenobacter sp. J193]|uniref:hypothetical protein n=1 Tax=Hymenobacter sp. J193 TaxID=2898429 RepID=UPI0021513A8E|nr:hypothetical protein [Hymenobacter sp. J193]MCR5887525.1 hypothetical protein [Hymenobacter sp. J193]